MPDEQNNVEQPVAANMILYGGAFDGEMLQVKYESVQGNKRELPRVVQVPIQRKVIAPRHTAPLHETYVLRDLQFSKDAKFQVYIAKGLSIEEFFARLLQNYKPSTE